MKNAIVVRKAVSSTNTGSPAIINNNSFTNLVSGGLAIKNEGSGVAVSSCNWFGTTLPSAIGSLISGSVTFVPWLTSGIDATPGTTGFQPSVVCSTPCNITLTETHVDLACPLAANGSINLTVNGAISPVTYSWTGPNGYTSIAEDPSGIVTGTYIVTVTADNGCTQTLSIDVLVVDVTPPVISCPGNITVNQLQAKDPYFTGYASAIEV